MADESVVHPDNSPKAEKKQKALRLPLNFLLGCSNIDLDSFELARLAKVSDLRKQMIEIMDELIDESAIVRLVSFFRINDRAALKQALETEESPVEWANRMIRGGGEIIPRVCLEPGQAHRIASKTYKARNIAKGKCSVCPKPLDRNSVQMCTKHLAKARARAQQKKGMSLPGTREYLYSGEVTPTHGRQPGSLASRAMGKEQKTRAVLAKLGIPPESAAVSLKAAKEALLKCMPTSRAEAKTKEQLCALATVPGKTTGDQAINELFAAGEVERIGKGGPGREYRYFVRKPSPGRKARQNQALSSLLKGRPA